jgi:hypothetical protein
MRRGPVCEKQGSRGALSYNKRCIQMQSDKAHVEHVTVLCLSGLDGNTQSVCAPLPSQSVQHSCLTSPGACSVRPNARTRRR